MDWDCKILHDEKNEKMMKEEEEELGGIEISDFGTSLVMVWFGLFSAYGRACGRVGSGAEDGIFDIFL